MGDGLDDAVVQMEGVLNQLLTVTGGNRIADVDAVAAGFVNLLELFSDDLHRIALAGAVIAVAILRIHVGRAEKAYFIIKNQRLPGYILLL